MGPVKSIDNARMRGNFSSHAGDYDSYAFVQKRVVELLASSLPKSALDGRILDVGTGTGALASKLLQHEFGQQLVIMDIAHGMTLEAAGRLPGVAACDGDARSLPFSAGVFASVVSSSVYQWVDCLPKAFAEVERILAPGGLFAVALFGEKTLFELRDSHCRAVDACRQGHSSHVQSFPSIDEVASALRSAGLTTEKLHSSMEVEFHADVPGLLRQLKQIGASNASSDRPRGLASRRVMQTMIEEYERSFRTGQGVPASYEVVVAVARKYAVRGETQKRD